MAKTKAESLITVADDAGYQVALQRREDLLQRKSTLEQRLREHLHGEPTDLTAAAQTLLQTGKIEAAAPYDPTRDKRDLQIVETALRMADADIEKAKSLARRKVGEAWLTEHREAGRKVLAALLNLKDALLEERELRGRIEAAAGGTLPHPLRVCSVGWLGAVDRSNDGFQTLNYWLGEVQGYLGD
jgi:hypothetical protein